jgi:hypothetical protein
MEFLRSLHRFVSSLKLGISLLLLLAIILAVATKFESNTSTHLVNIYVYKSHWFDALMLLFGINIFLATLNLRPWRMQHTGVIVIHFSILVILTGAWITRNFGFEGTWIAQEGETVDYIVLPETVLTVRNADRTGDTQTMPVWFYKSAAREHMNESFAVNSGGTISVDRYYTDAIPEIKIQDDGVGENPALHFILSVNDVSQDGWLFARQPGENELTFGGRLRIMAKEFADIESWKSNFAPAEPATIKFKFKGRSYEFEMSDQDSEQKLHNGYSFVPIRAFNNFSFGQSGEYEDLPGGDNPAIEFSITKGENTDHYIYFNKMPTFDPLHGQEANHSIVQNIEFTPSPSPAGLGDQQVLFGILPDKIMIAWRNVGEVVENNVAIGLEAIELPWMGIRLVVDQYYKRAWRSEEMRNAGIEKQNPAIRVRSENNDVVDIKWIQLGQRRQIKVNGRQVLVGYERQIKPLGFSLRLDDFVEDRYPGSMMSAGYASFVTLFENPEQDQSQGREIEISMNNTLVHGGFKFFQSSFQRSGASGPETTILSVNHDPGHLIVYVGSLLLVIGLYVVFFFKKKLIAMDRANKNKIASRTA